MAYPSNSLRIVWDHEPPGPGDGVTIHREIGDEVWEWRVPARSLVPRAMAADLLGVTVQTVHNWVRQRKMRQLKIPGHPSQIPLIEVKRIRRLLTPRRRLPRRRPDLE